MPTSPHDRSQPREDGPAAGLQEPGGTDAAEGAREGLTGPQSITFRVAGMPPAPQGSKRHVGGGRLIESCRQVEAWRERVARAALEALAPGCAGWADWHWAAWAHLHQSPGLTAAELLKATGPRRYGIGPRDMQAFMPDLEAVMAQQQASLLRGPVRLWAEFLFARPANHCRRDGTLKPLNPALTSATTREAPTYHAVRPDGSKLQRSSEDALSELVFEDDARVVDAACGKRWCVGNEQPGALITVTQLAPPQ